MIEYERVNIFTKKSEGVEATPPFIRKLFSKFDVYIFELIYLVNKYRFKIKIFYFY